MGVEAIVALVVTITQVAKSWIKTWFKLSDVQWRPWFSVALSALATVGVVLYDAGGAAINLDLLWKIVLVFALANGAKKIVNSLKPTR